MALLLDQPPPDHEGRRVPGAHRELQPAPGRVAGLCRRGSPPARASVNRRGIQQQSGAAFGLRAISYRTATSPPLSGLPPRRSRTPRDGPSLRLERFSALRLVVRDDVHRVRDKRNSLELLRLPAHKRPDAGGRDSRGTTAPRRPRSGADHARPSISKCAGRSLRLHAPSETRSTRVLATTTRRELAIRATCASRAGARGGWGELAAAAGYSQEQVRSEGASCDPREPPRSIRPQERVDLHGMCRSRLARLGRKRHGVPGSS